MSSRSKATIATSLAGDLEAALVQARARNGAAISFPDFLTSPEYAGPFNATVGVSPIVQAVAEASEGRAPTRINEAVKRMLAPTTAPALSAAAGDEAM